MELASRFPQFHPELGDAEPVSFLLPSGEPSDDAAFSLSDERAAAALEVILRSRVFDRIAIAHQRQGKFGTYSSMAGQEASSLGAALALDPRRDWIVPQYRELPALLQHGLPMETFISYYVGNPLGLRFPEDVRVVPVQIAIAAHLPQAVGLSWGLQLQGTDGVVVAFCGDGGTSEGDFHEAANLAGVLGAPIVFVVQNNGMAISTPRARQSRARTLASRAVGYGFSGSLVDGNDLLAVHAVVEDAVSRARAGGGPTLVECLTHRMGPHNTSDDPRRYRDDEEDGEWAERDPVVRLRQYVKSQGVWSSEREQAFLVDAEHEVESAFASVLALPEPSSDALFDHVFGQPGLRLSRQRELFRRQA